MHCDGQTVDICMNIAALESTYAANVGNGNLERNCAVFEFDHYLIFWTLVAGVILAEGS